MLRSDLVTIIGSPTGRHPCDTSGTTTRSGSSTTPTAPSSYTRSSSTSRFPPGPRAADARPPITVMPDAARSVRTVSAGNVNGSVSIRTVEPGARSGGRPPTTVPSGAGTASSRTGVTGPVAPAHRESAVVSSTSWPPDSTETAVEPSSVRGRSTAWTAPTMSSSAPVNGAVAKRTARSGWAGSDSRSCPSTSPTASAGTGCSERAAANGTSARRRQEGEGDDRLGPEVDAAAGLDGVVVLERELGPHQPEVELAGLDLEGLDVAGD